MKSLKNNSNLVDFLNTRETNLTVHLAVANKGITIHDAIIVPEELVGNVESELEKRGLLYKTKPIGRVYRRTRPSKNAKSKKIVDN